MARRKSRKMRRQGLPASLKQVNLNAAGIDVGATEHCVAVPSDSAEQCVRSFGAFTSDLRQMVEWLRECGVTTVAMESTSVYWIPLFEILESAGLEVRLVDPHHLKNVPGRKTDFLDCQWLQQLHTFGLLSGAFIPESSIRELRAIVRHRATLIEIASGHIQHMQKSLTQMNVKLQNVVSDITGQTGMKIIRAILDGDRSPTTLARMKNYRCKNDEETIAKALEGNWREEHLFVLRQSVELYEVYQEKIRDCDSQIENRLTALEDKSGGVVPRHPVTKRKLSKNSPRFDLHGHLFRTTGVDLTLIDGLESSTVLKILSETGLDMSRWPTSKHFSSWLQLCPNNRISGGKVLTRHTRPGANRAATAFRLAAFALHHSHSALGAFLRRQKTKHGMPKAITSTAHKLARIFYTVLRTGSVYKDPGENHFETAHRERVIHSLRRRARDLGMELVSMKCA